MGMNRTLKNVLTLVICLVVLAGIGVGIYFIYRATEKPADPEPAAIEVSFDANGGSVNLESKTLIVGESYGELPVPTRLGYTFNGWHTSLESGTTVEAANVVVTTEDHTLYAYWALNTYNVVLNENNGSNVNDLTYNINTETLTLPTPTREGYTFNGWFTSLTGGTKVESTDILSKLENQEYFAQWAANQFIVVFDSNKPAGAGEVVGTMENQSFTYDVLQNLTANTYSLEYYNFAGWATTANGSVEFTDSEDVKNLATEGNITLYAVWLSDNERVITFDGNGVAVNPSTKIVEVGEAYGELPTLTRAGYTFDGWFTALTGGTKVESTTVVPVGANHTLFAHWTINTYNVILNENGGSDVNNLTFTVNTTTLTLPTPTKANYVFAGWYTAATSGTKVEADEILATFENQEYYAQWTPEEYNVIFDENGGDALTDLTYTIESSDITLPIPTRDGYTFIGWFGVNVVSGTTYYVGMDFFTTGDNSLAYTSLDNTNLNDVNKVIGIDCDVFAVNIGSGTLIAKWEEIVVPPATVEITFNANGGSVNPTTATLTVGATYGELPIPTREGYSFKGWLTALENGTRIESTTVVTTTEDHILYADWGIITYNMILGGESETQYENIEYSIDKPDIILPTPTKVGYSFVGWFIAQSIEGTQYYIGADYLQNPDKNLAYDSIENDNLNETNKIDYIDCDLFAANIGNGMLVSKWKANKYNIIFDNQDATTPGTTSVEVTYDNEMPSITIPTKLGHTFAGYYTGVLGSGMKYYNSDGTSARIWDLTYNATLYAYWTENEYTVTLDNQSATTEGSTSVTATFGNAMPTITVPTRDGYTFAGYYAAVNGEGTQYYNADGTSKTNWDQINDTTLYAYWTENEYTVTLDNQFATTEGSTSVTATFGNAMPTITVPTRDGYTFAGYYAAVNGEGTQYYNADGTSKTDWDQINDATLYAYWIDLEAPTVSIMNAHYNSGGGANIRWTAIDNVGVVGYAITNSVEQPTDWITEGTLTEGTYSIQSKPANTWYVWAKDAAGNVSYAQETSYQVIYSSDVNTSLKITYGEKYGVEYPSGSCLLNGTPIYIIPSANAGYSASVTVNGEIYSNKSYMVSSTTNIASVGTALPAYFNSNWKNLLATDVNGTATGITKQKIKTIEFTTAMPTDESYNEANYILVGVTGRDSTTVNSSVIAYYYKDGDNLYHLAIVSPTGAEIFAPLSCESLFSGCSALTTIEFNSFITTGVTTMYSMFGTTDSLQMALTTITGLSNWDVSSVTNMGYMFRNCSSLSGLDLSTWNVSSVASMNYIFTGCSSLTGVGHISGWNVSSVVDMSGMFLDCSSLISLDLSGWKLTKVERIVGMFCGCTKLTSIGDVSNWDLSNCLGFNGMFEKCSSLVSLDLSGWNISSACTFTHYMFSDCSSLISLNLSGWDVSRVTTIKWMFLNCYSLENLDLSGWNLTSLKLDTQYESYSTNALANCTSLKEVKTPDSMKEGTKIELPVPLFVEGDTSEGIRVTKFGNDTILKTLGKTLKFGYLIRLGVIGESEVEVMVCWPTESIILPTPTRANYTFNGWYTAASGGTKIGDAGETYTPTGSTTLYAQWTANESSQTLTLNNQGEGSGEASSMTATVGSAMPAITVSARTGYVFGLNFTSTEGRGTKYYNAEGSSTRN